MSEMPRIFALQQRGSFSSVVTLIPADSLSEAERKLVERCSICFCRSKTGLIIDGCGNQYDLMEVPCI